MTVLDIKRLVALVAAALLAVGLAVVLGLAGWAVLAAQTGADRGDIFTDAAQSIAVEQPTIWDVGPAVDPNLVSERMRVQLAGLWHDTMVLRNFGGGEFTDATISRFSPELLRAFASGADVQQSPISSLVQHELTATFVSDDGHVVELVGQTTMGLDPRPEGPTRQESFTATMVLRTTGWSVTNLTSMGLSQS